MKLETLYLDPSNPVQSKMVTTDLKIYNFTGDFLLHYTRDLSDSQDTGKCEREAISGQFNNAKNVTSILFEIMRDIKFVGEKSTPFDP